MSTSFFDLPREIRDIIYENALVSPTGYITPILDKSSRSARFSIHTAVEHHTPIKPRAGSHKSSLSNNNNTLSLSLPRTCRQIYQETSGLFWSNTFLFPDLPTLTRTLKSMGQGPSRQIKSISVNLYPLPWRALPKAFALLTSRARHGCFEKLHLDLQKKDFGVLTFWKNFRNARYDEVLEMLRESSKECNFQRSIGVGRGCDGEETELGTVRDLHLAFGGRMIYDGRLQWDNYEHIGKCAGA